MPVPSSRTETRQEGRARADELGAFRATGDGESLEVALRCAFRRLEIQLADVLLARDRLVSFEGARHAA